MKILLCTVSYLLDFVRLYLLFSTTCHLLLRQFNNYEIINTEEHRRLSFMIIIFIKYENSSARCLSLALEQEKKDEN